MTDDQVAKLTTQQLQELVAKEQDTVTTGNSYSQDYWKAYEELETRKQK